MPPQGRGGGGGLGKDGDKVMNETRNLPKDCLYMDKRLRSGRLCKQNVITFCSFWFNILITSTVLGQENSDI